MKRTSTIHFKLSSLLAVAVFIAATAGVLKPAVYDNESFDRQVYFVWHDYVNLFLIIPVLLVSGYLASKGRQAAQLVWGGTLLYTVRASSILTFTLQGNAFFLFHCLILALSLYALGWLLYNKIVIAKPSMQHLSNRSLLTAAYLIIYAACYFLLILWNTIPTLNGKDDSLLPLTFKMFIEPTRVFDMPVLMPLLVITALMLIKDRNTGRLITPVLLMSMFLFHTAIAGLDIVLYVRDMRPNLWITFVAIFLSVVDVLLLRLNLNIRPKKEMASFSDISTPTAFS